MKLIAFTVAFTFLVTNLGVSPNAFAAAATPVAGEVALPYQAVLDQNIRLAVPQNLGKIEELHFGKGPAVFHIQTAHGHYEAQQQIRQILHHLDKNYGVKTVLVEGSAFQLDPQILNFFPKDKKLTQKINDALTQAALVKGPELYLLDKIQDGGWRMVDGAKPAFTPSSILRPSSVPVPQALGIENAEAYRANRESFVTVLNEKKKTEQFLADMDMQIERLASHFLNKDLRDFLKRLEAFEKNQIPFDTWLSYVKGEAQKRLGLDLASPAYQIEWPMLVRIFKIQELSAKLDKQAFPKERDEFLKALKRFMPGNVERETQNGTLPVTRSPFAAIESLLRNDSTSVQLPDPETSLLFEDMVKQLPRDFNYDRFPNVRYFIGTLLLQSELKAPRLMEETQKLAAKITDKLTQNKQEKELTGLLADHRLLQKLFALELVPADYEEIIGRRRAEGGGRLKPSNLVNQFDSILHPPSAIQRVKGVEFKHISDLDVLFDKAMTFYKGAKERDQIMEQMIEKRLAETGADRVAVITGGFHAQPFNDYFSGKDYTYALISPKLSGADEAGHEAYIHNMLRIQEGGERKAEGVRTDSSPSAIHHPSSSTIEDLFLSDASVLTPDNAHAAFLVGRSILTKEQMGPFAAHLRASAGIAPAGLEAEQVARAEIRNSDEALVREVFAKIRTLKTQGALDAEKAGLLHSNTYSIRLVIDRGQKFLEDQIPHLGSNLAFDRLTNVVITAGLQAWARLINEDPIKALRFRKEYVEIFRPSKTGQRPGEFKATRLEMREGQTTAKTARFIKSKSGHMETLLLVAFYEIILGFAAAFSIDHKYKTAGAIFLFFAALPPLAILAVAGKMAIRRLTSGPSVGKPPIAAEKMALAVPLVETARRNLQTLPGDPREALADIRGLVPEVIRSVFQATPSIEKQRDLARGIINAIETFFSDPRYDGAFEGIKLTQIQGELEAVDTEEMPVRQALMVTSAMLSSTTDPEIAKAVAVVVFNAIAKATARSEVRGTSKLTRATPGVLTSGILRSGGSTPVIFPAADPAMEIIFRHPDPAVKEGISHTAAEVLNAILKIRRELADTSLGAGNLSVMSQEGVDAVMGALSLSLEQGKILFDDSSDRVRFWGTTEQNRVAIEFWLSQLESFASGRNNMPPFGGTVTKRSPAEGEAPRPDQVGRAEVRQTTADDVQGTGAITLKEAREIVKARKLKARVQGSRGAWPSLASLFRDAHFKLMPVMAGSRFAEDHFAARRSEARGAGRIPAEIIQKVPFLVALIEKLKQEKYNFGVGFRLTNLMEETVILRIVTDRRLPAAVWGEINGWIDASVKKAPKSLEPIARFAKVPFNGITIQLAEAPMVMDKAVLGDIPAPRPDEIKNVLVAPTKLTVPVTPKEGRVPPEILRQVPFLKTLGHFLNESHNLGAGARLKDLVPGTSVTLRMVPFKPVADEIAGQVMEQLQNGILTARDSLKPIADFAGVPVTGIVIEFTANPKANDKEILELGARSEARSNSEEALEMVREARHLKGELPSYRAPHGEPHPDVTSWLQQGADQFFGRIQHHLNQHDKVRRSEIRGSVTKGRIAVLEDGSGERSYFRLESANDQEATIELLDRSFQTVEKKVLKTGDEFELGGFTVKVESAGMDSVSYLAVRRSEARLTEDQFLPIQPSTVLKTGDLVRRRDGWTYVVSAVPGSAQAGVRKHLYEYVLTPVAEDGTGFTAGATFFEPALLVGDWYQPTWTELNLLLSELYKTSTVTGLLKTQVRTTVTSGILPNDGFLMKERQHLLISEVDERKHTVLIEAEINPEFNVAKFLEALEKTDNLKWFLPGNPQWEAFKKSYTQSAVRSEIRSSLAQKFLLAAMVGIFVMSVKEVNVAPEPKNSADVQVKSQTLSPKTLTLEKTDAGQLSQTFQADEKEIRGLAGNLANVDLSFDERQAALYKIEKMEKSAIPVLIRITKDPDLTIRMGSVIALGKIGYQQGVPALLEALNDKGPLVRLSAIEALGEIGDKRAVQPLTDLMKSDKEPTVREAAKNALEPLKKRNSRSEVREDRFEGVADMPHREWLGNDGLWMFEVRASSEASERAFERLLGLSRVAGTVQYVVISTGRGPALFGRISNTGEISSPAPEMTGFVNAIKAMIPGITEVYNGTSNKLMRIDYMPLAPLNDDFTLAVAHELGNKFSADFEIVPARGAQRDLTLDIIRPEREGVLPRVTLRQKTARSEVRRDESLVELGSATGVEPVAVRPPQDASGIFTDGVEDSSLGSLPEEDPTVPTAGEESSARSESRSVVNRTESGETTVRAEARNQGKGIPLDELQAGIDFLHMPVPGKGVTQTDLAGPGIKNKQQVGGEFVPRSVAKPPYETIPGTGGLPRLTDEIARFLRGRSEVRADGASDKTGTAEIKRLRVEKASIQTEMSSLAKQSPQWLKLQARLDQIEARLDVLLSQEAGLRQEVDLLNHLHSRSEARVVLGPVERETIRKGFEALPRAELTRLQQSSIGQFLVRMSGLSEDVLWTQFLMLFADLDREQRIRHPDITKPAWADLRSLAQTVQFRSEVRGTTAKVGSFFNTSIGLALVTAAAISIAGLIAGGFKWMEQKKQMAMQQDALRQIEGGRVLDASTKINRGDLLVDITTAKGGNFSKARWFLAKQANYDKQGRIVTIQVYGVASDWTILSKKVLWLRLEDLGKKYILLPMSTRQSSSGDQKSSRSETRQGGETPAWYERPVGEIDFGGIRISEVAPPKFSPQAVVLTHANKSVVIMIEGGISAVSGLAAAMTSRRRSETRVEATEEQITALAQMIWEEVPQFLDIVDLRIQASGNPVRITLEIFVNTATPGLEAPYLSELQKRKILEELQKQFPGHSVSLESRLVDPSRQGIRTSFTMKELRKEHLFGELVKIHEKTLGLSHDDFFATSWWRQAQYIEDQISKMFREASGLRAEEDDLFNAGKQVPDLHRSEMRLTEERLRKLENMKNAEGWGDHVLTVIQDWYTSAAVNDRQRQALERLIAADEHFKIKAGFDSPRGILTPGTAGTRGEMEDLEAGKIGPNYFGTTTVIMYAWSFVADYKDHQKRGPVLIAKEVRDHSDEFAELYAKILVSNGISVVRVLKPISTPFASYLAKWLEKQPGFGKPAFGFAISASHNKLEDNGTKFMGPDGQQLMPDAIMSILKRIPTLADTQGVPVVDLKKTPLYTELNETDFEFALNSYFDEIDRTLHPDFKALVQKAFQGGKNKFVFTPLNGATEDETSQYLSRLGLIEGLDYVVVPQDMLMPRELPASILAKKMKTSSDPANDQVLADARKFADERGIKIVMARDPDGDRFVVAANTQGTWKKLDGNQNAIVMAHDRLENSDPAAREEILMMRSHATTPLLDRIAGKYGVAMSVVPVGFKYFGAMLIRKFNNKAGTNFFGAEESYGTSNGHVNEKDGLTGLANLLLILARHPEGIFAYLDSIYFEFGFPGDQTININLPGNSKPENDAVRQNVLDALKTLKTGDVFGPFQILSVKDSVEVEGLGKFHDGFDFVLKDEKSSREFRLLFRPSGTEPIFKAYFAWQSPLPAKTANDLQRAIQDTDNFVENIVKPGVSGAFDQWAANRSEARQADEKPDTAAPVRSIDEMRQWLASEDLTVRLEAVHMLGNPQFFRVLYKNPDGTWNQDALDQAATMITEALGDPSRTLRHVASGTTIALRKAGINILQREKGKAGTSVYAVLAPRLLAGKVPAPLRSEMRVGKPVDPLEARADLADRAHRMLDGIEVQIRTMMSSVRRKISGDPRGALKAAQELQSVFRSPDPGIADLIAALQNRIRHARSLDAQAVLPEVAHRRIDEVGGNLNFVVDFLRSVRLKIAGNAATALFGVQKLRATFAEGSDIRRDIETLAYILVNLQKYQAIEPQEVAETVNALLGEMARGMGQGLITVIAGDDGFRDSVGVGVKAGRLYGEAAGFGERVQSMLKSYAGKAARAYQANIQDGEKPADKTLTITAVPLVQGRAEVRSDWTGYQISDSDVSQWVAKLGAALTGMPGVAVESAVGSEEAQRIVNLRPNRTWDTISAGELNYKKDLLVITAGRKDADSLPGWTIAVGRGHFYIYRTVKVNAENDPKKKQSAVRDWNVNLPENGFLGIFVNEQGDLILAMNPEFLRSYAAAMTEDRSMPEIEELPVKIVRHDEATSRRSEMRKEISPAIRSRIAELPVREAKNLGMAWSSFVETAPNVLTQDDLNAVKDLFAQWKEKESVRWARPVNLAPWVIGGLCFAVLSKVIFSFSLWQSILIPGLSVIGGLFIRAWVNTGRYEDFDRAFYRLSGFLTELEKTPSRVNSIGPDARSEVRKAERRLAARGKANSKDSMTTILQTIELRKGILDFARAAMLTRASAMVFSTQQGNKREELLAEYHANLVFLSEKLHWAVPESVAESILRLPKNMVFIPMEIEGVNGFNRPIGLVTDLKKIEDKVLKLRLRSKEQSSPELSHGISTKSFPEDLLVRLKVFYKTKEELNLVLALLTIITMPPDGSPGSIDTINIVQALQKGYRSDVLLFILETFDRIGPERMKLWALQRATFVNHAFLAILSKKKQKGKDADDHPLADIIRQMPAATRQVIDQTLQALRSEARADGNGATAKPVTSSIQYSVNEIVSEIDRLDGLVFSTQVGANGLSWKKIVHERFILTKQNLAKGNYAQALLPLIYIRNTVSSPTGIPAFQKSPSDQKPAEFQQLVWDEFFGVPRTGKGQELSKQFQIGIATVTEAVLKLAESSSTASRSEARQINKETVKISLAQKSIREKKNVVIVHGIEIKLPGSVMGVASVLAIFTKPGLPATSPVWLGKGRAYQIPGTKVWVTLKEISGQTSQNVILEVETRRSEVRQDIDEIAVQLGQNSEETFPELRLVLESAEDFGTLRTIAPHVALALQGMFEMTTETEAWGWYRTNRQALIGALKSRSEARTQLSDKEIRNRLRVIMNAPGIMPLSIVGSWYDAPEIREVLADALRKRFGVNIQTADLTGKVTLQDFTDLIARFLANPERRIISVQTAVAQWVERFAPQREGLLTVETLLGNFPGLVEASETQLAQAIEQFNQTNSKYELIAITSEGSNVLIQPRSEARAGRILVLDNNPNIAKLNRTILESEGYRVEIVETPVTEIAAVPQLQGEPFDLVITNQQQVIGQLKKSNPGQAALLISGSPDTVESARRKGMDALQKPVSMGVLLETVKGLIAVRSVPGSRSEIRQTALSGQTRTDRLKQAIKTLLATPAVETDVSARQALIRLQQRIEYSEPLDASLADFIQTAVLDESLRWTAEYAVRIGAETNGSTQLSLQDELKALKITLDQFKTAYLGSVEARTSIPDHSSSVVAPAGHYHTLGAGVLPWRSEARTVAVPAVFNLRQAVTFDWTFAREFYFGIVPYHVHEELVKGLNKGTEALVLLARSVFGTPVYANSTEANAVVKETLSLTAKPAELDKSQLNRVCSFFGETVTKTSDAFILGPKLAFDGALALMRPFFGDAPVVVLVRDAQDREAITRFNLQLAKANRTGILMASTVEEAQSILKQEAMRLRKTGIVSLKIKALVDASESMAIALKEKIRDTMFITSQAFENLVSRTGISRLVADFKAQFALAKSA